LFFFIYLIWACPSLGHYSRFHRDPFPHSGRAIHFYSSSRIFGIAG